MSAETKTDTYLLFPTVLQVSRLADWENLNRKLLKAVYDIKGSTPNSLPATWVCNVYTTIASPIEMLARQEFHDLKTHIMAEANRFADTLALDRRRNPLRITECWLNVYNAGDAQEVHNHQNNVISGVYYVKAPKGSAPITFHSPTADTMLQPPIVQVNDANTAAAAFEPHEGQMVLFRSFLKHSVKTSRINEDRISIAFNLTM